MQSVYGFVVTPKGSRYNNTKNIDGKELIINSEIYNHQFTNREALVLEVPKVNNTNISKGDTVLVHHNVFWNLPKAMMIKGDTHEIYNNTSFDISGVDFTILDESYESKSLGVETTFLSRITRVVGEPIIRFLEECRH